MRNTNTKQVTIRISALMGQDCLGVNWTAAAVNRYYHCQKKIQRAEALNQSYSSVQKWYREYFKAEDFMRAMGI